MAYYMDTHVQTTPMKDISIPVRAEDFLVSNVPTAYHSQYSFEYVSHDQKMCKCAIEYLSYVT